MLVNGKLFRPEVAQAQSAAWLGAIRVARPPGFAWVAGVSAALLLAFAGFAWSGQITRKARVPGVLVPTGGLAQVTTPIAGVVTHLAVAPGQEVQQGQVLLHVKQERHSTSGDTHALVQAALAQRRTSLESEQRLTAQQQEQRRSALEQRIRSLAADERQALAEVATATQRVQLAHANQQRYAQLLADGFVSRLQAQQREEERLDLQAREAAAVRQVHAIQRERRSLRAEQDQLENTAQTGQAQLQRALAALQQEQLQVEASQTAVLRAPRSGRVGALALQAGQQVAAGQLAATLVSASAEAGPQTLQAHLFAPARAAGFLRPGQAVWLRYAPYPYQKFGMARGEVLAVSETPLSPQELPVQHVAMALGAAGAQEGLRSVTVRLAAQHVDAYGERIALVSGTPLEADVVQETRAVWEWVMEPVLASRVRSVD